MHGDNGTVEMLILSGKYHGCRPSTVSQPVLSGIFSGWAYFKAKIYL